MKSMRLMPVVVFLAAAAHAEGDAGALAAQLKGVKVTLAQGLKASTAKGKPISAKFEVENGKLQLCCLLGHCELPRTQLRHRGDQGGFRWALRGRIGGGHLGQDTARFTARRR